MRTQHEVVLALLLVAGASWWALSGTSETDPYRDVHQVTEGGPSAEPVSVKGTVVAGTVVVEGRLVRFALADASGDPTHADVVLNVTYTGVLPDAFGPKMVVVTGAVNDTPTGPVLAATDIQVGCSSKY